MRLIYSFEGVDCPNCAAKIEAKIAGHSHIISAQMDFAQSMLRVEAREGTIVDELERDIRAIFAQTEDAAAIRRIELPADTSTQARRFILPQGDFHQMCHDLRSVGAEIVSIDENTRIVSLTTALPWHRLLSLAEEKLPGLLPYAEAPAPETDDDPHSLRRERVEKLTLAGGFAAFLLSLAAEHLLNAPRAVVIAAFAIAYLLSAYPVLIATWKSIRKADPFDENFLMSVATIGAFVIGENAEGVLVMLLYRLGELFQDRAVSRSRDSIRQLMALKPDHANLLIGGRSVSIDPAFVRVGDHIEVRPGERVPLDGVVIGGTTSLDVSDMTGESAPRDIAAGDEALSGTINGGGLIRLEVTQSAGDSSVARVLRLVQESGAYKARKERIFTRFARVYTPIVCLAALLVMLVPPLFFGQGWYTWIYRGLSFLVVSCPCALVLSIPLSFFGGVGAASKRGVLVKGGECLESLARVDIAVFDKTGTLTEGVMEVAEVRAEAGYDRESLLRLAAAAESRMNHPIAEAIIRAADSAETAAISDYENIPGEGIRCRAGESAVAVGNLRLMKRVGAEASPIGGTAAYVAVNGAFAGAIRLEDRVRSDAAEALATLKRMGFRKTAMLTGDNAATARSVGERLGLDDIRAELLPDQKVGALLDLSKSGEKGCLFVGDGVNDAPVLAAADVGAAMGGVGSDAAIAAADVVLLSGNLSRIGEAVSIARRTQINVYQNISLALGVKLAAMSLIALGVGEMWMAVVADAGVALLCVLNALQLTKMK